MPHIFSSYPTAHLAERFYKRAIALKPYSSYLRDSLAFLYQLWGRHERQALQQLERAVAVSRTDSTRCLHMCALPAIAYAADDVTKAAKYADRLLA
jgi:Tfp pilus assembly protein PilF